MISFIPIDRKILIKRHPELVADIEAAIRASRSMTYKAAPFDSMIWGYYWTVLIDGGAKSLDSWGLTAWVPSNKRTPQWGKADFQKKVNNGWKVGDDSRSVPQEIPTTKGTK